MGFIDSYKHLEKLCGEVLNDDRRVSAYIDEMLRTPRGSYYVRTWDEDLKNLKHYRWVRNQISHEPGCTEQNMCEPEDELWLDEFYSRIMNQTDPLSLYHQATRPRPVSEPVVRPIQSTPTYTQPSNYRKSARNNVGCATMVIVSLLVVAGIVLWDSFLWRSFGFKFCENPEYSLVNIKVEDNCCYVLFEGEYGGSSSSATYNDIVYEFADGILKIGAHKSFALNASTEISEEITVNGAITEVRICGKGNEKVVWTAY